MKKPDSIKVTETVESKKFEISTFDSMQLLFQIVVILIPFLLIEILMVKPDSKVSVLVFISGVLLIAYWMLINIMGKYEIILTREYVVFRTGYPIVNSKEFNLTEIKNIIVRRRSGKKYTGGRAGVTTTGPDVDDYYVVSNYGEYLMIPKCSRKEKEYLKFQILNSKRKPDSATLD